MKTLYLECGMGAAGDMLMAALYELIPDRQAFLEQMQSAGIPGVRIEAEKAVKCGITGTHMKVTVAGEEEESLDVPDGAEGESGHPHDHDHPHDDDHDHEHHHHHDDHDHEHHHHHDDDSDHDHHHHHHHDDDHDHDHHHHHDDDHDHDHHHHHDDDHDHEHHHDHDHDHHHHHATVSDIDAVIGGLNLPEKVREDARAVYALIAEAEGKVHGHPVTEVHFHEVGAMDAVADVVGVCLLMHMIGAERICASPVHVGSGQVRCMHGIVPVPAPATAEILKGIPTFGGRIRGELCTPTGAALLRYFARDFGEAPVMAVESIGYGMGKKDFEQANCVRAFLGESREGREQITKLECNLDDMTGEELGYAMNRLFSAGARDVYTQAIGMKKSRPGVLLSVICLPGDADRMAELIMKHTTTLGIRRQDLSRYGMRRHIEQVETPFGSVRIKKGEGHGSRRQKLEYEDLAAIAEREDLSMFEVREMIRKAGMENGSQD